MSDEALWYISRATGVVSLLLLTGVLVLGVITSARCSPHGESATIVMGLHRWLSLGMTAFLATHIVTAIADGYVSIGWFATVLPFTSGYERFWIGLGTIAVDLLIAIVATSLLRHRLRPKVWKAVHWFAYAMWPIAVVHGFALGTSDQPLLQWTTILCGAVGVGAIAWRMTATNADSQARAAADQKAWT